MKRLLGVHILLLAGICSWSQTPMIDSLRKELPKNKPDSIKVHDRIRISWYLMDRGDSAAAWNYILQGDSIANRTGNPVLKGIVLEHFGFLHSKVNSKKAVTFFLQAESILKNQSESPAAKKSMASLALNTGYEHFKVGDNTGALDYFFKGIKLYDALDTNHFNLPILYTNIINCYYSLQKFDLAKSYCQKYFGKIMANGNNASKMGFLLNYGMILQKMNQKTEADKYLGQAKLMADSLRDDYYLAKYYQVMAVEAHGANEEKMALALLHKGLPHILRTGYSGDIASYYNWLGIVGTANSDFTYAHKCLAEAYKISTKEKLLFHLKDVYENRALLYKAQRKYEQAMNDVDSFHFFRDSLLHFENADKTEFLDAKYQGEKREEQIRRLQAEKELQQLKLGKKRIWMTVLLSSIGVLAIVSFLLIKNNKQKHRLQQQRIAELEAEKQLAATESVLKGEEQERTRLAKDLHDGLGGMLSGIKYSLNTMKGNLILTPENAQAFERSMDMLDSSIKEMRRVAHNMMPEALVKFGLDTALRDFCNDINQSGALQVSYQSIGLESVQFEQTTAITIYRIVQELVNNIMKHAAASTAIVQVSKTEDEISITVEDDGKGFDPVILQGAKGIGWGNIQGRIEYLKGKLDIRSAPGKGTSVHIEILI